MPEHHGGDPAGEQEGIARADVHEPVDVSDAGVDATIGTQVGRGLRWSIVGILVTKMASFLIGLVLARLLTPHDFGVFAIAMAVTAFLIHVNDAGVIAAVVQWRGRLETMTATASTIALAFSVTVYAIVFAIAPWFADLTSSPKATWVIRVLAAVIVIDGITAVRSGMLMRRFQQDKLTVANLIGFVVQAPLSIVLALNGAGAFSFAVAQLVGAAVTGVFVFGYANVPREYGFDRGVARKLLRFGLPLAASLGVEAILVNADYLIVGHLLGPVELGFYLLAFNVSSWVPGIVTTGVRYVSVAGFSRLAEDEDDSLTRGVAQSMPMLVALVLPIAALMAILAPQIVATLYGGVWAPSGEVLRFLMILMAGRVLVSFAFDILTSAGATRSTLWLNVGWAVVLIPALWIGTKVDGIRGTAVSHAIVALVVAVPLAAFLLERAGVRLGRILPALIRLVVAAAVGAAACLLLLAIVHGPAWAQLVVAGAVGFVVYAAFAAPPPLRAALRSRLRGGARPTPADHPDVRVSHESSASDAR